MDAAVREARAEGATRRLARWLLAALYLAAGIMHLKVPLLLLAITPSWVAWPREVVIGTGVAEIAGAVGLLTARFRRPAGWALAAYAVCVYPANIQHALNDLSAGTGLSWWYHGPRLAAQPLIVWWALWASGVTDWPWRVSVAARNPRRRLH